MKLYYTSRLDNGLSIVAVDEAGKEHEVGHGPAITRTHDRNREKRCVLKERRIGGAGAAVRDTKNMRRSFRTRVCFDGWIPRVGTLGWYAMPRQGMEWETQFPLDLLRMRWMMAYRPNQGRNQTRAKAQPANKAVT